MPNINEKKMLCKKISKNAKNEGKKKSNLVTLPSWIGRHRQQKLHTWTAWLEKTREMIPFQQHQKKNLWKHRWNFSRISAKNHQNFNVSPFFMYLPSVKSGHIFFKVFFRGKVQQISKLKPVSNGRYESSTFYLWPIRILEICIFMWKNNNFENYVLLKSPDRTGWNFQWFAIL